MTRKDSSNSQARLTGPLALVHTPAELSASFVRWAEETKANPGIQFGVPKLDQRIIPLRPGKMAVIIGRPGMGKSSLMASIAKRVAESIRARGASNREVVVYVTWEQVVQEMETMFQAQGEFSASDVAWCRVDIDTIRQNAVNRAELPLWMIGYSLEADCRKTPEMTLENVFAAIKGMEAEWGVKPVLMIFDYIQIIPANGYSDRIQRVADMPAEVKKLAMQLGTVAICGVQASREVDKMSIPRLPEMCHCQWGSSTEQAADLALSVWRPALTEPLGTIIKVHGKEFTVTEDLFFLQMVKQRFDAGRFTWYLHFEPQYLRLADLETRYPL